MNQLGATMNTLQSIINKQNSMLIVKRIAVIAASAVILFAQLSTAKIKDYGLHDYVYMSKALPHSENNQWYLVCQLPYNAQYQPWIQVDAPAGKTITVTSSNALITYNVAPQTYTTTAGTQTYEAPSWISGQGAIYTIPAGVTVTSAKYHETGFDTKFSGSFSCNDSDYTLLWERATRTCYLCMRDHFMDCPDRERTEYVGDAVNETAECYYAFDTSALLLCKNFIGSGPTNMFTGQNFLCHSEYGDWLYYLYSGDLATLARAYGPAKAFLDPYTLNADGLTYRPGYWYDWGASATDAQVLRVAMYYVSIKGLRKMAKVTGHAADTAAFDTKISSIKANFNRVYWTSAGYRSSDVSAPDDRANAWAVIAGLADSTKWPTIFNVLHTTINAGCFFDRFVFEALCMMGRSDEALLRMSTRYKTMLQSRVTTIWEHYDREFGATSMDENSTLNHGWSAPNVVLSQYIAGVAPESPGWTTYHVLPQEAFLTSIRASVATVKGQITVSIQKNASTYTIQLNSPSNTSAIVGIPKISFSSLTSIDVNGTTLWDGTYAGGVTGISWDGEDSRFVKFNVAPGSWTITAHGNLPMTTPKQPYAPVQNEVALDKRNWRASASIDNKTFQVNHKDVSAESQNAIDGDYWTGWRTGQTQAPGQWFQIDMQQPQTFSKVVLDDSWDPFDYPQSYSLYASNDPQNWGTPIATGSEKAQDLPIGITTIVFPETTARYLKIVQTGSKKSSSINGQEFWSIFELDVYKQIPISIKKNFQCPDNQTASTIKKLIGGKCMVPLSTKTSTGISVYTISGKYMKTAMKGRYLSLPEGAYIVKFTDKRKGL